MSDISLNTFIKTGSDPRSLPEFNAIRDEINKVNRPSLPEINWRLIESLALTLFRNNGVDLQTAIYYTFARTQLNGLAGFTEGTELLAGIVVSQWEHLWPETPQARCEILEWYNARVGGLLRQYEIGNDDLRMVYRAERALQLLADKLQQVELKRVPRIENLLYLMQNTVKRLDASGKTIKSSSPTNLKMSPMVYLSIPEPETDPRIAGSSPPNKEEELSEPKIEVRFAPSALPVKRLSVIWGFMSGVSLCLLTMAAVYFFYFRPIQQQLIALQDKPAGSVLLWLARPDITTYGLQMKQLAALPPLENLHNAHLSVLMARQLWPADPRQIAESSRWEQSLQAQATGITADSYFMLQGQLQALSDKLLQQEKIRGGVSISYLKTAIYDMQTELTRQTPLEELLRQLNAVVGQHQQPSPALIRQIDEQLNSYFIQYYQLTMQAGSAY
jgi:type VI secretion system protein VasL